MWRVVLTIALVYCFADVGYGSSLQLKPYNITALNMFLGNDPNLDGHIDRDELRAVFVKYDVNGDGVETRYEYTEFICATDPPLYQLSHYLFDEYDVSGDHVMNQEDYDALFDKMDGDGDEVVDLGEFIAYWEKVFPKYENVDLHLETLSHGPSSCH